MVWTGHGWIAAVIVVGAMLGVKGWVEASAGPEAFFGLWVQLLVVTISVFACSLVGRWLNRGLAPRIWDGPSGTWNEEAKRLDYHPPIGHTLGYIRVEHAGWLILVVLALLWLDRVGFFG